MEEGGKLISGGEFARAFLQQYWQQTQKPRLKRQYASKTREIELPIPAATPELDEPEDEPEVELEPDDEPPE